MSYWTKPVFRLHMWGDPCGGLTWVPHTENLLLVSALCSFRPTGGKTLILLKIFSLHSVRASEAQVTSHHAMLGYCICWSPTSEGSSGVPVQNGMVTCSSRARLHTTDLWKRGDLRSHSVKRLSLSSKVLPEWCDDLQKAVIVIVTFSFPSCHFVPLFVLLSSHCSLKPIPNLGFVHNLSALHFVLKSTAKLSDSDEEIFRGDKQLFIMLWKIHKHTSVFHALQDSIWKGMKPLQWPCLVSAPFSFLGSIEIILNIFILGSCLLVHKKRK